jgi:hypothetical protein
MGVSKRRTVRQPPAHAVEAAKLTKFVREHLPQCPAEDWDAFHDHSPSYGDRVCVECSEPWPCSTLLRFVSRWPNDPGFDPAWLVSAD